jgi:hypothetical protein
VKLSRHFTLDELTRSDTAVRLGLDNSPTQEVISNLQVLAQGLERVRAALGSVPLYISSGYRSPEVNKAIGGSRTSQHMAGEAADFTAPEFGTPTQIAEHLAALADSLQFDQLILEGGRWVHISFTQNRARRSVLTATFTKGIAKYTEGLV